MPRIRINADVNGVPFGPTVLGSFIAQLQRYCDSENKTREYNYTVALDNWNQNRRVSPLSEADFVARFGPKPTPPRKLDFWLNVTETDMGGFSFDYGFYDV